MNYGVKIFNELDFVKCVTRQLQFQFLRSKLKCLILKKLECFNYPTCVSFFDFKYKIVFRCLLLTRFPNFKNSGKALWYCYSMFYYSFIKVFYCSNGFCELLLSCLSVILEKMLSLFCHSLNFIKYKDPRNFVQTYFLKFYAKQVLVVI